MPFENKQDKADFYKGLGWGLRIGGLITAVVAPPLTPAFVAAGEASLKEASNLEKKN